MSAEILHRGFEDRFPPNDTVVVAAFLYPAMEKLPPLKTVEPNIVGIIGSQISD